MNTPVAPSVLDAIPTWLNMKAGRPAAVLVGLMQRDTGWHVIMTERSAHLAHHAGQISFPGGKVEDGDGGLVDTALREAREEIALAAERVEVIGGLGQVTSPVGFVVQPVVGIVAEGACLFRLPERSGANPFAAAGGFGQFAKAPAGELSPRRSPAHGLGHRPRRT